MRWDLENCNQHGVEQKNRTHFQTLDFINQRKLPVGNHRNAMEHVYTSGETGVVALVVYTSRPPTQSIPIFPFKYS